MFSIITWKVVFSIFKTQLNYIFGCESILSVKIQATEICILIYLFINYIEYMYITILIFYAQYNVIGKHGFRTSVFS